MPKELGVIRILNSLNKDYDQFFLNYNMHRIGKMIAELNAILKLCEKGILTKAKTPVVLDIQGGVFTIELHAFSNSTWVYDTGCGTHICNTSQGISRSRKWKHEALIMYIGNEMHVAIEAIRSFDLILPSGLIIVLDNCHFASTVTRGVVSISRLVKNGYIHIFTNYGISVSKDNVFYFNEISRDGTYEIDMHNLYPNVSSNYNVSNKRAKHGLDSYYLWHCRLGHINKKLMVMLQHDGLLQPTYDESHEKYDFIHYGFVYLMKHKHEVFETRKFFQNDVENQLDKKIKAIQTDRGGEYLSHEFVNHTKSCGIVSQLNPPYTSQHNEVSERKNQTLLDMVRSMMNLTTLPKSFWGYALETEACILNIVPTKKLFKNSFMVQEASGSHGPLKMSRSDKGIEIIQEEDTQPSENTSKEHNEVVPIKEYELGDLDEPPNYKAALADPEFDKWLEAMNTKMQSMKDNQVWILFKLPPNGRTVGNWKSAKQSTTSMSSIEAEYIATAEASMEVVWIRKFINRLGGVMPLNKRPMEMLYDNEPALAIVSNPRILKGANHFKRKYHYICKVIQEGEIVLKKVHTNENIAAPFTKPMPFNKHFEHAMSIGIVPTSSLRVLRGFLLHHSSINNSASLSNKFGKSYSIFKFGISGLVYHVVTAIADRIRELLEYMVVYVNDASESLKPSWGKHGL
nr:hypothetical protein [Tanacetum cinerariifolium]